MARGFFISAMDNKVDDSHQKQYQKQGNFDERQKMQTAEKPDDIRGEEYAQDFGKNIAAVGKPFKKCQGKRQKDGTDDQKSQPPDKNCRQVRHIMKNIINTFKRQ